MRSPRREVIVLGAGITGCALAYHLARRGISPVSVYDPRTPAAGATGRAAGIVTEQLWDPWDVEVTRESHREYAELAHRWDPSAYSQNGFVRWTGNPEAAEVFDEARERLRRWGVEVEIVAPADLARNVPWGRFDDVLTGLMSRHDAVVTPSAITTIYAEAARQSGVAFDFGRPTRALRSRPDGFELDLGTESVIGRNLVVAAGAWSKRILAGLGHRLPLTPYRTQAALLRPAKPAADPFPSVHDLDLDVYVRPEANGRILAGDGTQRTEADPEKYVTGGDEAFLSHLAESLESRFPGWTDSEVVSSWAGVCTATFDRHPLIGPVSSAQALYVIVGFNGFGVMRAGGAARRLADLIADGDGANAPREALAPVWPGRLSEAPESFPPRPGFTLEAGDDPRF